MWGEEIMASAFSVRCPFVAPFTVLTLQTVLPGPCLLATTFWRIRSHSLGKSLPSSRAESNWGSRTEQLSAAALGHSSEDPTCRDAFCYPLESPALSVIRPGPLLYPALSWGSHELPHLCPAGSRKHWPRVTWLLGARAMLSWVVFSHTGHCVKCMC